VNISGKDPNGKSASSSLTVEPPLIHLIGLTILPSSVQATSVAIGTIKLSKSAGSGGFVIQLSSSGTAVTVPSQVTVPSGALSTSFNVTSQNVSKASACTVTASDVYGYDVTAKVTVQLPTVRIQKLAFSPQSVGSNSTVTGTVTLTAAAPKSGFTISLTSDQSALTLPKSVTVVSGAKIATFKAIGGLVKSQVQVNVDATDPAGYSAETQISLMPPAYYLSAVVITPTSIPAGGKATCTVRLSAAAPAGGLTVTLSTMQNYLSLPLTVTVAPGSFSGLATITAGSVALSSSASVTGMDSNGFTATGSVLVNPSQTQNIVQATDGHEFLPTSLTVPAGTIVTWTNQGSMDHTVTSDLNSQHIDSGIIGVGQSFCWTVPIGTVSGTRFYYHCIYHGFGADGTKLGQGMVGVVTVQ